MKDHNNSCKVESFIIYHFKSILTFSFYLPLQCEELADVLTEKYHDWMGQYLVMKRASIEMNFHPLYANFIDQLKIAPLTELTIKETLRNIQVCTYQVQAIQYQSVTCYPIITMSTGSRSFVLNQDRHDHNMNSHAWQP